MKFESLLKFKKMHLVLMAIFVFLIIANLVFIQRPSITEYQISKFKIFSVVRIFILICNYLFVYIYYLYLFGNKNKDKFKKTTNIFLIFLSIILILFDIFLYILETKNYPNFVYSQLRIHLPFYKDWAFSLICIPPLFLYWKYVNKNKLGRFVKKINIQIPSESVLLILLFILMINSLKGTTNVLVREFHNVIKVKASNIDIYYYAYDLDKFSNQMKIIRENTNPESVILLPPQNWDYPEIGNQVLVRYFLFPRILVSPGKKDQFFLDYKDKTCILYSIIAKSYLDEDKYFPEENRKASWIKLFYTDSSQAYFENVEFDKSIINKSKDLLIGLINYQKCGY